MKKIFLFTILCTVILFQAKGQAWSRSYWYSPVSYSEAKVYFQIGWGIPECHSSTVYVAGEGPLPDSNEGNTVKFPTVKFPFIDFYRRDHSWVLPCREGGKVSGLGFKGETGTANKLIFRYVTVDEGITHIGNWWFEGLVDLQELILSFSLQSTGEGAFKGCTGLPMIWFFDKVKTIGSRSP
ncbi:MAG: leucine-rich repeat domain-containing protein [Dysgonamonadaceae bacterium]|nr:leucine-rich repeat domain-containing protein [Dysgonamonadaceae bacterium]